jgi:biopolymer transport protein ExbD
LISQALSALYDDHIFVGLGNLANVDATNAQFDQPYGVTLDNDGNIYVSDTFNNLIRVVDATTNMVSTYAGSGSTAYNGAHIAATAANLNNPYGITVDASGNVYFADKNHYAVRFLEVVSPTSQPTGMPSSRPSLTPTMVPSTQPSGSPTRIPTDQPSSEPSSQPTERPSAQPTGSPTNQPSEQPTSRPTMQPSQQPSEQPTSQPSMQPSADPTGQPSRQPTSQPTRQPTFQPSSSPTTQPTGQPTRQPSKQPTTQPSGQPSCVPTSNPTIHREMEYENVRAYFKRQRANGLCDRNCSGHGICMGNVNCQCFTGLDHQSMYTGSDCSLHTCPKDIAWVGAVVNANNMHPVVECSNRGVCHRDTGVCSCFPGYSGIACQRQVCPMHCHGRGICLPERILASRAGRVYSSPWDSSKSSGCLCDAGFRGPSCELKECPSGADVLGGFGNEAGQDCSGRGICDYATGKCDCFSGFLGTRCENRVIWFD